MLLLTTLALSGCSFKRLGDRRIISAIRDRRAADTEITAEQIAELLARERAMVERIKAAQGAKNPINTTGAWQPLFLDPENQ